MSQNYIITNGELYHYGVPGMKWGKRKAIKKLSRIERRYQKYQDAADRYKLARDTAMVGRDTAKTGLSKASNAIGAKSGKIGTLAKQASMTLTKTADRKAVKYALKNGQKYLAAQQKADKWKKKLDKVAEKKNIDLGKGTVDEYLLRQVTR